MSHPRLPHVGASPNLRFLVSSFLGLPNHTPSTPNALPNLSNSSLLIFALLTLILAISSASSLVSVIPTVVLFAASKSGYKLGCADELGGKRKYDDCSGVAGTAETELGLEEAEVAAVVGELLPVLVRLV